MKLSMFRYPGAGAALLLLAGASLLPAAPVGEVKVRKTVQTWVRKATADRRPKAEIARVEPFQRDGETVAYVIHLADGGYCLAGADSLTLPVYWYAPQGVFDPKNPGCQVILGEIADRVGHLKRGMAKGGAGLAAHRETLAKREQLWDSLAADQASAGTAGQADTGVTVAPGSIVLGLSSQWNQNSPYNDQCPVASSGTTPRTLVGCVATAMSQVMRYWRWPNTGSGSASVTYRYRATSSRIETPLATDPRIPGEWGLLLGWSGGKLWMNGSWDESVLNDAIAVNSSLSYLAALVSLWESLTPGESTYRADFGATTYQWDLLKDQHTNADPVDSGDQEAAKLSLHAGLAVGMDYGLSGSGASRTDVPGALRDHFRYHSDARLAGLDTGTMVDEIKWGRPVILCGNSPGGGHCWVVYGYNLATLGTSPWQFRMNMGWGGNSDGWYSVDDVPNDYTSHQEHVIGIAPANVVRFVSASALLPGNGSPGAPYRNIEEAITQAPDRTTLMLKANSVNTFSAEKLVVERKLTLKGIAAIITK